MKAVLIALSLLLVSFEAHAISRYNSTSMSCGEIKATVRGEGAVILRWRGNSGTQRYGRFVAHGGFCESRHAGGNLLRAVGRPQVMLGARMQILRSRRRLHLPLRPARLG